ncbi:MAG: serine hydrolase domain-containing protein [Myxococcota bacterium]|nr:serine hydrolase domain-containing protein [Myxococcota bacterium]
MSLFEQLINVFPADEVTTISNREVSASEAGLSKTNVDKIWKSVRLLYATGLHPAISLCIRRHGKVVIDRAIGHARGNAPNDSPMVEKTLATPDTLFNLFSASKVVTAMLIHLLDERGDIHVDDSVAEYIPEFRHGKKRHISIRHILTHRAGIPNNPGHENPVEILTNRDAILDVLCRSEPTSHPGRFLAYHAITGGFILGEIIYRVTGMDPRQFLEKEITTPLNFKHFNYGVPIKLVPEVAQHAYTGPPPAVPYRWLLERSLGVDIREAVRISNDHRFLTSIIPSANIISTANETCRFFELLLREGQLDGLRLFDKRTIRRAVAEQSYMEIDTTLALPVRYSMGFMLGGDYLSFYGFNSRHAFGHLGFTNVLAYADPDRDISVCLMNTGKPFVTPRLLAWLNVMRVIASQTPKIT